MQHQLHPYRLGSMPSALETSLLAVPESATGYEEAGFALGRFMGRECPMDADLDEWGADDSMLALWLHETFPRVMSCLPARRTADFVAGVRRAHEEGLI